MNYKTVTVLIFYAALRLQGQVPTTRGIPMPLLPQTIDLSSQGMAGLPNLHPQGAGNTHPPESNIPIQQQNQLILQKVMRDGQRSVQERQALAEARREIDLGAVQYEFPDQSAVAGTEFYRQAYAEINRMLKGEQPLNLKRAVFLTENAYLDNRLNYDWFAADISGNTDIIKSLIIQQGYKFENPTARKWGLQQFLADTVLLKDEKGKVVFTHKPFAYDFEDPWGKQDWTKQFVTKLMGSGRGQCHSMPLLYLILAEELGIRAWLAYSPSHTYVKVDDGKGNLLNFETTNGYYTTDVWVQSSGYIKAEALRSGIYMDTLSKKELIAACLADLAKGYALKFGFDKFVLECVDKALEYHPNNVYALQVKSDYQSYLLLYVLDQLGHPPVERLPDFPNAYALFLKMHEMYGQIDAAGFEEMPEEVYARWLQSFETEKGRQPKKIIRP